MNVEGLDPARDQKVADRRKQILSVMLALPHRDVDPPDEAKLHRWAAHVADATPWNVSFKNGMKHAGRSVIEKEISVFIKNIRRAEEALLDFHSDTIGKALDAGLSVRVTRESLRSIVEFANKLEKLSLSDIPERIVRGKEHNTADYLAQHCAMYFYWITGRPPGRANRENKLAHSQYREFLSQIFKIMEIDASADERARHAADQFKSRWGNGSGKAGQ